MKLIIVNNNMHIGGVQKALVNLLKALSDKYDITLFLFYPKGALMDLIPDNVKVIKGNFFTRIMGMSHSEAKKEGILTFLWRSICTVITRIFGIKLSYKLLSRMQKINNEYDVAVSYMQNSAYKVFYGGCNEFVLNSVTASKKISFVHCDFKNYIGNNTYNKKLYAEFDLIACVSHSCEKIFNEVCPEYKNKTHTVYNFYDILNMNNLADNKAPKISSDEFNIFTSARISEEKGILRCIPIIAKLSNEGMNIRWYIAGDGAEGEKARIMSEKLNAPIEFMGFKANPYPYFKASDLVLIPSYNEAAPMVYAEAMNFGTQILTTNTTSANEFMSNYPLGNVCNNTDADIENALRSIVLNGKKAKQPFDISALNIKAESQFSLIL